SADAGLFQRLGEYGFGGADPAVVSRPHQLRELNGQAATKKRKLDLVAGLASAVSKAIVTKRSKSPKKKPQTITDKATAPFAHDQAGASTILNYFANPQPSTNPSTIVLSQQEVSNECNEKHDRSGQAKSSKPKVKKKKKSKEPPIVHPPELAVRVANEQDLLFGTCSQLARDESPSFIRDLQRAVKKSEAVEDSQLLSQGQESQLSAKSSSSSPSITRLPSAARSLWSVAARNEKGSLLDVDVVDLVDSPQARRSFSAKPDLGSVEEKKSIPPASAVAVAVDSDWRTIDTLVINQGLDQHEAEHSLPRSVAEASVRARPKSRPPVKKSTHRIDQELSTTEGEPYPEMPNYKGFTDVDLKRAVSKTGFKAIRKREDMISHLERCWQAARSRMRPLDTSARPTSANIGLNEATKSSSAAKKRGRPPKNISALTDEDGAAVTSTVSPKKPRGRPKKGASRSSTSSKLQAKDYSATNSLQQSSETQLVDIAEADHIFSGPASPPAPHKITAPSTRTNMTLLATITNAVTSCPPTHDVQNLTPYEKMLLYDPIVLEDFAQWLNDEGLKRVGCNETVVPTVAKLWCESQSVCCLWRENLKGGTRARY
ncbi:MAG: hypothetical protein L6R42_004310, partial [Xanthoria sp. 1 TBL-2021]